MVLEKRKLKVVKVQVKNMNNLGKLVAKWKLS